jgi:16S rRNA (guanine527-N7)-methyltransferase
MILPADFSARVRGRAQHAGVELPPDVVDRLTVYAGLLALWNRRINLTAFNLSSPTDEAIDRLLVEPVAAASLLRREDRRVIDLGTGGGSPAVPLAVAVPAIEMTMVEVRAKKAAFLREVVRELALVARVETATFQDVAARTPPGDFDVVMFRAVRADGVLWGAVERLLSHTGRVLWFGGVGHTPEKWLSDVAAAGTTVALVRV